MKKRMLTLMALLLSVSIAAEPSASVLAADTAEDGYSECADPTAEATVQAAAEEAETIPEETASADTEQVEDTEISQETSETADESAVPVTPEENSVPETPVAASEDAAVQEKKTEAVTASEETDSITLDGASDSAEEVKTYSVNVTVTNSQGAVSGMYAMDSAVATKQDDGTWLVRMHQSAVNRNYMALTDDQDAATNHLTDWYISGGSDGYWYVIPVKSLDEPLYASFSKTANVQAGKAWSAIQTIRFDSSSMQKSEEADVTTAEMNVDKAAAVDPVEEKKTFSLDVSVVNSQGAVSGMYAMDSAVATKQDDGTWLVRMHQSAVNRNYMALTDDQDAATNHLTDWYISGGSDGYWYVIPVQSLDEPLYASFSKTANVEAGKAWSAIQTIKFDSSSLKESSEADVTAAEMNIDKASSDQKEDEKEDEKEDSKDQDKGDDKEQEKTVPADGVYTGTATTNALMFKVSGVKLTVKNGKMSAVITLSGSGYDYLYMGTKEEAIAAGQKNWIPAVVDSNGNYTYSIPVEALDQPIKVASRSARYAEAGKGDDAWFSRELTIASSSLKKVSDSDDQSGSGGSSDSGKKDSGGSSSGNTDADSKSASKESEYSSDTSGSTSAVNSSTTLKDGVYTPDAFSFSGGTGKVQITCSKVTVTGGKAYATLAFSSTHFSYVKANGNTYYPSVSGGSSYFTIPVELNKNNSIIGLTTAMSQPHEVTYSIYVYLAAAAGGSSSGSKESTSGMVSSGNTALDEKAPEIVGLEYKSETKLDYAEYFKIYNYEDDITLLEIDTTKDTARDPEKQKTSGSSSDSKSEKTGSSSSKTSASSSGSTTTSSKTSSASSDKETSSKSSSGSVTYDEEGGTVSTTAEDLTADLYKGNVVKYLIVPEGEEIPTGLDKDMIIIEMPKESIYAASDFAVSSLEDLDTLDLVTAVGTEQDDCSDKEVVKKMKDGKIVYGGDDEDPEFKQLVKAKTDLAILSSDVLPKDETDSSSDTKNSTEKKTSENADTTKTDKSKTDDADTKTVEEQTDLFETMTEHFAMLGIPVVFDRSEDEQSDLAKDEWVKVYGVLTGHEKEAEALFEKEVSAEKK